MSLTSTNLTVPAVYAPTKIIAGLSASKQFTTTPNLVAQLITPKLSNGIIQGASVFDADNSLASTPQPFALERQLWGA